MTHCLEFIPTTPQSSVYVDDGLVLGQFTDFMPISPTVVIINRIDTAFFQQFFFA